MKLKYFICAAVIFIIPAAARAAERIESFDSHITIYGDGSLLVQENILYNFDALLRHGIFRDIPYKYNARGGNYSLRFSNFKVTDENGNLYKFAISQSGGVEHIKVGDPNVLVSGQKTYNLSYKVEKAINYFSDHDELYWNVTGNSWTVPINQSSATIALPKAISSSDLKIVCYAGAQDSQAACSGYSLSPSTRQSTTAINFRQDPLLANQGLTIVVSLPKGIIAQPTQWQNLINIFMDNWILFLPIPVFFIFLYLWFTRGRDPKGYGTIVPQYEPLEDLTPTEMGTIVDEKADDKDITADIVYLAVRGYLKITRTETKELLIFKKTDYNLDLLKDPGDIKNPFEKKLMKALFKEGKSVKLSDLQDSFYEDLGDIKNLVYSSVVEKGYFPKNPNSVRSLYGIPAIVILGLGIFIGIKLGQLYWVVSAVISAIIILSFAPFMPAKTKKGAEARQYILGLKLYLSVAEKDP